MIVSEIKSQYQEALAPKQANKVAKNRLFSLDRMIAKKGAAAQISADRTCRNLEKNKVNQIAVYQSYMRRIKNHPITSIRYHYQAPI